MKLAILLLYHKNVEQINLLLQAMRHPDTGFYIHMDKRFHILERILNRSDVHILPDSLRVDVQWSRISMIQATLNLLREACGNSPFDFTGFAAGRIFHSSQQMTLSFIL